MNLNEIINDAYFKDEVLAEQKPIITIQEKICAYPQNFICINGLPKSYKTTFAFFFIESGLSGREVFDIKVNIEPGDKIILIDTEQSIYDFTRQSKNLKRALKVDKLPVNFSAYLFRKYEPEEILKAVSLIVETQKPKILILDNLTELIANPNDMLLAKSLIQYLKKLSSEHNLVIICLLHNAKSTLMSIGNIGSYADRGAQTSVTVKHDREANITTMEATLMRSDTYFNPISIQFDTEQKKFIQITTQPKEKKSRKFILNDITEAEHKDIVRTLFINTANFTYTEFIDEIKKIYGVGDNIAKQQIVRYLRGNNFVNADNGIYTNNKNK